MNEKVREYGRKYGKPAGKITGGGAGLLAVYMFFNSAVADVKNLITHPETGLNAKLAKTEMGIHQKIADVELRLTSKISEVEKNLNESSQGYIDMLTKTITRQDEHEKNYIILRQKVASHQQKGPSAHRPE